MADAPGSKPPFDLNKKVGPLPVWGWLGAVMLGLAYGYYRQTRAHRVDVPTSLTADGGASTATQPGIGNAAGLGGSQFGPVTPGTTAPASNDEWSVRAQAMLVGRNYDALAVSNALAKYLVGQDLTAAEAAIVSEALRLAGPPPYPPPATSTPSATPTNGATGAGGSWDTWQAQNLAVGSLAPNTQLDWGMIARRTFGTTNPSRQDVYLRALALQQKYPTIHTRYLMYVPANVAATITWP